MNVAWGAPMLKQAASGPEMPQSNEEIRTRWHESAKRSGLGPLTVQHYHDAVAMFLQAWGPTLATQLTAPDIQAYIDRLQSKCSNLLRSLQGKGQAPVCSSGLDVLRCPLLRAEATAEELESCPSYKPLDPITVLGHLYAIGALYDWLTDRGYVASNPVTRLRKKFAKKHRKELQLRREQPVRRALKLHEVQLLIQHTPIFVAALIAFMAKTGTRLHEAVKISMDAKLFDLKAGVIEIPRKSPYGNKRLGNRVLIVDDELRALLQTYLQWRNHQAGATRTDYLFLNCKGRAWNPKDFHRPVNKYIARAARLLDLIPEGRVPRKQAITSHCLRGFFTTWILDRDCPLNWAFIMRGDGQPGALTNYNAFLAELRMKYNLYAPQLQLPGWLSQPAPAVASVQPAPLLAAA